jgi:dienelactone hydrolase
MISNKEKLIIIIHEIYGITDSLIFLKQKLESQGFTVLLPCLYSDCYSGSDEFLSYTKFYEEVGLDKATKQIEKIISENTEYEISIIGFSIGATIAWLLSEDARVHQIIGVYGSKIRDYQHINPIVKTSLFFCNENAFDVDLLISNLSNKNNVAITKLNANHGFYSNYQDNITLIDDLDNRIFSLLN